MQMYKTIMMVASLGLISAGSLAAQASEPLSAQASDPETMGWMQGFPPPEAKRIRFTDNDYFAFPKLRWTVCHFRELMPTAGVRNGDGAASKLPRAIDPAIGEVEFTPLGRDDTMTWDQAFQANYTDGLLVMHHGRIVYERYAGCLDENTLHGVMSVTKSLTGLMGETLVARGELDESQSMGELIPELADSGFGDATVRQVLEMGSTHETEEIVR